MRNNYGRIFLVSGPSGAGKSTLIKEARRKYLTLAETVSCTTRKPRKNEIEGQDYYFMSREDFKKAEESGAFIESCEVHGEMYGTTFSEIESTLNMGLDVVIEIDVKGAAKIKSIYEDSIMIFILPPSFEKCRERLRARGTEKADSIIRRLTNSAREVKEMLNYEYVIKNDELDKAIEEFNATIIAARYNRFDEEQYVLDYALDVIDYMNE